MSETGVESPLTTSVWHRPLVLEEVKDRLARRQANAAVALLRLGREQRVWPILQHCPDPRTRSYLIHRFGPLDADPHQVLTQLDTQGEVSIRRALILILGEFSEQQLLPVVRERLSPRLLDLYANDPDPGIHGAVAWTLRRWGHQAELQRADRELATGMAEGNRRWYVNGQGQTLVIIPPPGEIVIGSPPNEVGREDGPEGALEMQHRVRIGHKFELKADETTVAEFLRFRKEFSYRKRYSPKSDCPINNVSWYEAVSYRNWLNEQEGIAKEQWCYLPNDQGEYAPGMRIARDYLRRTGYRLPTEAEWEFACRAGSVTSRYYGQSPELDNRYAWTVQNGLARWTLPVGTFKPNDLGLFDMHGNVMEWCQDRFRDYSMPDEAAVAESHQSDDARNEPVNDQQMRVSKSTSIVGDPWNVRSAYRYRGFPNGHYHVWGFRLARTYLPDEGSESGIDAGTDRSRVLRCSLPCFVAVTLG